MIPYRYVWCNLFLPLVSAFGVMFPALAGFPYAVGFVVPRGWKVVSATTTTNEPLVIFTFVFMNVCIVLTMFVGGTYTPVEPRPNFGNHLVNVILGQMYERFNEVEVIVVAPSYWLRWIC